MTKADAKRREERAKLAATALANVGTASVVTGFIAPVFGGDLGRWTLFEAFGFGLGFHALGQLMLHFVVSDKQEPPP